MQLKSEDYYLELLNTHKKTGYMFKVVPVPSGMPVLFTITNVVVFSMAGVYFGYPMLAFIPCFVIVWEHYMVTVKRSKIFESCLVDEAYMKTDFRENGADPNYPNDPLYVTNEDREDIFYENLVKHGRQRFLDKIKSHHFFGLVVMALYLVAYLILPLITP
jgi:hypothetical protein